LTRREFSDDPRGELGLEIARRPRSSKKTDPSREAARRQTSYMDANWT
jgi:hypothetical protein